MILGIDTSAYTTSVAVLNTDGSLYRDERRVLNVPIGQRGLRQAEAVFQHVKSLPEMITDLRGLKLHGIAVSNRPRPIEGSYMPVFIVGQAVAQSVAACTNLPLWEFSHQEGHISAGLWSSKLTFEGSMLVLHISGGTSDVLAVRFEAGEMQVRRIGTSTDLHAGQFVDRIGVALGTSFPAGAKMDCWSQRASVPEITIPSATNGCNMSFSGPTTEALRLLKTGVSKENLSLGVFRCIAKTLEKVIRWAMQHDSYDRVLLVGGVASNSEIRVRLKKRLSVPVYFASPRYSTDNSVGTAVLGLRRMRGELGNNAY